MTEPSRAAEHPLILVVDDDVDFREAVTAYLDCAGFDVRTAADGSDALALLACGLRPAVILLDQCMPRVDGLTFRQRQLEDAELAAIPVVIYMAGPLVDARGALVVAKTIEPRLLLATLRAICAVAGESPDERRTRQSGVIRAIARLQRARASSL